MSRLTVSIALPTLDGIATLPELFERLRGQRLDADVEIVAVDSGSVDGSRSLLARQADRLIEISPAEFNHGLTRNLLLESTRGALVVLLVQDALPASPSWLAELIAPLLEDPWVAGAYARQLPRPDASALTRRALSRWAAADEVPRRVSLSSRAELDSRAPIDRLRTCAFDNVCACIRRSVWRHHPFRATPIAEDLEWAKEVLLAGHTLAFAPAAAVFHSHERSVRYELKRTYQTHRRLFELFGVRTIPSGRQLLSAWASSLVEHTRVMSGAGPGAQWGHALGLAVAWPLGQYLGGLHAARGGHPFLTPGV